MFVSLKHHNTLAPNYFSNLLISSLSNISKQIKDYSSTHFPHLSNHHQLSHSTPNNLCGQAPTIMVKYEVRKIGRKRESMNSDVRVRVIAQLIQLCQKIKIDRNVFQRAIMYIDKYSNTNTINNQQYPIIGLTALWISIKLQTAIHPTIEQLIGKMQGRYPKQRIIQIQQKIVKSLKYQLNLPTISDFMRVLLHQFQSFKQVYTLVDIPHPSSMQKQIWLIVDALLLQKKYKDWPMDIICYSIIYLMMCKHRTCTTYLESMSISSLEIGLQSFMSYMESKSRKVEDLRQCLGEIRKWWKAECKCLGTYHLDLLP